MRVAPSLTELSLRIIVFELGGDAVSVRYPLPQVEIVMALAAVLRLLPVPGHGSSLFCGLGLGYKRQANEQGWVARSDGEGFKFSTDLSRLSTEKVSAFLEVSEP